MLDVNLGNYGAVIVEVQVPSAIIPIGSSSCSDASYRRPQVSHALDPFLRPVSLKGRLLLVSLSSPTCEAGGSL